MRDARRRGVSTLTRALDTGGAEPRPLRVERGRAGGGARGARPGRARRRSSWRSRTCARSPRPASTRTARSTLPAGAARARCARCRSARAAVYVPGGRAPYPSTVVMGVVTARAAGVRAGRRVRAARADGDVHPAILAACALAGADEVYRMGGAQAIAALAYGTETVAAGRRDRRARATSTCRRPSARCADRVGIDGFAGPSDLLVVLDGEARRARSRRSTCARRPSTAPAASSSPSRRTRRRSTRSRPRSPTRPRPAPAALVRRADLDAALAFAEAFAPEHLRADRRRRGGARAARHARRLPVRRRRRRDRVRRLPRRLEPRAADRRRRALRLRASPRAPSAAAWRRCGSTTRRPPRSRRTGAAIARAEGFEAHAQSMEARIRENGAR